MKVNRTYDEMKRHQWFEYLRKRGNWWMNDYYRLVVYMNEDHIRKGILDSPFNHPVALAIKDAMVRHLLLEFRPYIYMEKNKIVKLVCEKGSAEDIWFPSHICYVIKDLEIGRHIPYYRRRMWLKLPNSMFYRY